MSYREWALIFYGVTTALVLVLISSLTAHGEEGAVALGIGDDGNAVTIRNLYVVDGWVTDCPDGRPPVAKITMHPREGGKYRIVIECPNAPGAWMPGS